MKALRFDEFGDLSHLRVVECDKPSAGTDGAVVAVRAASINPSDVKNVQGKMEGTTLPRTPGRDYSGVVVDGPKEWIGAEVWGLGGEIGYTIDGTHAEFVRVPAASLARKPKNLSFEDAAASGVNFVTAFAGLVDRAMVRAGDVVLVTGARGGVGSSVIQLARWSGARTVGIDRSAPAAEFPPELAPDLSLTLESDFAAEVARFTGEEGASVVYDVVGSSLFERCLAACAHDARYAIISSVGERRASFDVLDFYHKRLTLLGIDSRGIDAIACARILDRLRPGFETGRLRAPVVHDHYSLDDGRPAYEAVDRGAGKAVFVVPPTSG